MKRRIWNRLLAFGCLLLMAGNVTAGPVGDYLGKGDAGNGGQDAGMCLSGGWELTEDLSVPEDAMEAFDQAMQGLLGVQYEPLALLATQVVAGTNYCFLAKATVVIPDARPEYTLVYVYRDLQGGAQLLDIQDLPIGVGVLDDTNRQTDEPQTESPVEVTRAEHTITAEEGEHVIIDYPRTACAGDIVKVTTVCMADADPRVDVNGQDIGSFTEEGLYEFIMPDEDVVLTGWADTSRYPGA